jgi:carbon starvation protein
VIDPNGGVNILWPLFGIANQMLAGIALSVATGILVKSGKAKYALVTLVPLAWLAIVTTTAAFQKVTSANPKLGFFAAANDLAMKLASGVLPPEKAAVAPTLIFNQRLDGWITMFFTLVLWFVIADMLRVASRSLRGLPVPPTCEAPFLPLSPSQGERAGWHALRQLSGDDAYDQYVAHQRSAHPDRALTDRATYYREREVEKWSGVKRCC